MFICNLVFVTYLAGTVPGPADATAALGAQQSCRIKSPKTPCVGEIIIQDHPTLKDQRTIKWLCVEPKSKAG